MLKIRDGTSWELNSLSTRSRQSLWGRKFSLRDGIIIVWRTVSAKGVKYLCIAAEFCRVGQFWRTKETNNHTRYFPEMEFWLLGKSRKRFAEDLTIMTRCRLTYLSFRYERTKDFRKSWYSFADGLSIDLASFFGTLRKFRIDKGPYMIYMMKNSLKIFLY